MQIYNYDKTTSIFTKETTAKANPLVSGEYLTPAFATTIEPLDELDGYARYFNGSEWEYKLDYRGQSAITTLGPVDLNESFTVIDYVGDLEDGTYLASTLETDEDGNYYSYYNEDGTRDTESDEAYLIEQAIATAKEVRTNQFAALDLYDKAVLRGDIDESDTEKSDRDTFRTTWLDLPSEYTDSTVDITTLYPDMPDAISYFY